MRMQAVGDEDGDGCLPAWGIQTTTRSPAEWGWGRREPEARSVLSSLKLLLKWSPGWWEHLLAARALFQVFRLGQRRLENEDDSEAIASGWVLKSEEVADQPFYPLQFSVSAPVLCAGPGNSRGCSGKASRQNDPSPVVQQVRGRPRPAAGSLRWGSILHAPSRHHFRPPGWQMFPALVFSAPIP